METWGPEAATQAQVPAWEPAAAAIAEQAVMGEIQAEAIAIPAWEPAAAVIAVQAEASAIQTRAA